MFGFPTGTGALHPTLGGFPGTKGSPIISGGNYHEQAILALNPSIYFPLDDDPSGGAPRNLGNSNDYTFSHNLSSIPTLTSVSTPWGQGLRYQKETTYTNTLLTAPTLVTGNYSIGLKFYYPDSANATDYCGILANHGRGVYLNQSTPFPTRFFCNQVSLGGTIIPVVTYPQLPGSWISMVLTFQETPSIANAVWMNGTQLSTGTGARQSGTIYENVIGEFFPEFYMNSSSFFMILKDFFLVNRILSTAEIRSVAY